MKVQSVLAALLAAAAGVAPGQTLYFPTNVPSNWSAATGSLAISTNHYKCPTNSPPQCLQWNYGPNDILTVANPGIPASGVWNWSQNTCDLWVYNPAALRGQKLQFQFADTNGTVQFFFDFYLNYTGWRQAVRSYRYDMSAPGGGFNLATVSVIGPTNVSGQVCFDAVAWMDSAIGRNKDLQNVDIAGYNSTANYYHSYNELQPDIPTNTPTAAELNDLAAIRAAWLNANAGSAPSASSVSSACASWTNLNIVVNGSNIMGQVIRDTTSADNYYAWLQTLAQDVYWNHTADSANKLSLFLRHWWDQGMDYNSGVAQAGGAPGYSFRTVPSAFVLGYPAYDAATRQHAWQMFQWLYRMGHYWSTNWMPGLTAAGADDYTLTDDVYLDARRELGAILFLAPDDTTAIQYLKGFKRYVERFLTPSFGTSDGIKVDGLGFHHNAHYNAYMYALPELSDTLYSLRGTGFQVNSNAYFNLRGAFFAMLRMANGVPGSSSPGYTANSLCGRHPFSTSLPFDCTTLQRLGDWGGAVQGLAADPVVAQAYNRLFGSSYPFGLFSGYGTEPNPTGFYQYNYSPIGIYRQSNWVACLHGMDSDFWGSEIYATENQYGRYQSYGACEILYPGGNAASGFGLSGWDWNKPPGSTTILLPWSMLKAEDDREDVSSALNFSGALASPDGSGLYACNFQELNAGTNHNPSFAWRKSWFCFTNQIICLGSSITNDDTVHPTITTLFQGSLTNPAVATVMNGTNISAFPASVSNSTASANWLLDGCGTGYFVRPGATLRLDRTAQASPDQSGSGAWSTNNYATAWMEHGTAPGNAGYEYVVVPGSSSAAMAQLASNYSSGATTPYTVLECDATAHVVQWRPDGRIGYALFGTDAPLPAVLNAGPLRSVSLPCLATTQPVNSALWLTVVNPDLNLINNVSTPANVDVTLAGNWSLASASGNATVLSATTDATVVRFQTVDGLPVRVLLLAVSNSLTAPAAVAATVVSTNQINLAWTPVSGAIGYIVRRGGIAIASVTGTSYSDTGLSVGTTYTYTVLSTNADGTSPESMPATACTPTPGTPPTAGSVLSWDADFSTAGDQDGSGTWTAATLNWLNGGGNVSWVDNCTAVFGASPTTNCTVTLGGNVAPARITVNAGSSYTLAGNNTISTTNGMNLAANGYATISATISGSKGLTNAGTGTLTLAGVNSYTGGTTVNAGTVNVNNDQSAATGGWTVASGVGTVNLNPGSTVAVAGGKTILLGGNSSSGSTLTAAGTVRNSGSLSVSRRATLNVNSGANWLQSGTLSVATTPSTGYSALMNVNPGAMFTYTGSNAMSVSPSSGTLAGGAVLTIAGGTLVTGQGFTNATLTSAGTGNIVLSSNGTLRLTANIANLFSSAGSTNSFTLGAGGGVIDTAAFSTTLGTAIGGTGSLTKLGTGSLTLSGSNSFTGATSIGNGTLALASAGALNNSAALNLAAGATLDVSALGAFVLSSKTTLSAAGTASAATITGAAAGTVNLGSQPLTLTCDGSHPALYIAQGTLLLNSNAFTVNSSSPLLAGVYPIVQQNGGSISSSGTYTVSGTAVGSGMSASIRVSDTNVNLVISEPSAFSKLAASQVVGYGVSSVALNGTLSGSGPVYPAVGETVTVSINGNLQTATIADSTGDFFLNFDVSSLPASATPYTITYAYGGNAYLSAASDSSRTLLVAQAGLALSVSASPISYGQTLGASSLSGSTAIDVNNGAAVPGSFAFSTPGLTPGAGTTNASVTFTPADLNDYSLATATVAVTVDKTTPTLNAPLAGAIAYGQPLAACSLTGGTATNANTGDAVTGSFAFTSPGIIPNAGITNASVAFTPADTANYNAATTTVAVLVIPARATFQWDANAAAAGAQDGSGIWSVTATNWLYSSNNLGWFDHEVAVFGVSPSSNCIVTLGNDVTPAGITFNATNGGSYTIAGNNTISTADGLNITASGSATISAAISGSKGLTNAGTGTLTLSGTNSYTGGTTVNAGTVNVSNDQSAASGGWALTNGTAKVTFNAGSTLAAASGKSIALGGNLSTGGTLNVAGTVTNNGGLTVGRRGTLNLNGGAKWLQNGAMSVASGFNSAYPAYLTINPGATFTYAGANSISVSPCANNAGGAVLTIGGGTLATGQGFTNATVTSTGTGSIVLSSNGTLRLTANIAKLFSSAGSPSSVTLGVGGGVIDTADFSTTLGTAISGSGSLTKLGAGTLTLSGSNSFSGTTTVGNGTLALASAGALNNSAAISLAAGATLDVAALSAFVLSSNTSLSAAGTTSAATITGAAAGTVNLGSQPITLTYDGAHPALSIAQGTLMLNGNAFTVNSSSPLMAGIYPIVQQNGGSISSSGACTVSGTAIGSGMSGSIWVSGSSVNLVISEPSAFSNLAASQAIGYGATSVGLSGTVSGSGPVYPAAGEIVMVSINGNLQTATIVDSTGDFFLNYDVSTLPASPMPYTITYAYEGNACLSAASDTSRTLLVNKADLTLSVSASPIRYGQTFGASSLNGSTAVNANNGAVVAGSFAFTTPGLTPNAGTTNVSITFTPADLNDYSLATAMVAVTVGKAMPTLTAPVAGSIAYGQTLGAASLTGGAATNANNGAVVAGSFAFAMSDITPNAGTTNVGVIFTPVDTDDYTAATMTLAVTVGQTTPVLTVPTASAIAYGQTLESSLLAGGTATNANDGVAIAGSFAFTTPDIAPKAGTTNVSVTFTPVDTNAYTTAMATVAVTVGRATPTLAAPTVSTITYGQALGAASLTGGGATNANNGAAVAGNFAFTTPGITPSAGTTNVGVTFTPVDTDNYTASTMLLAVTVAQATPVLTAPTAGTISYGQTLGSCTLTGGAATNANTGAAVAGSFAFTAPALKPDAGTNYVSVTFTPADSMNYNAATSTVAVWVAPVGATFQWDADVAVAGAQDGSGIWSVQAANWLYNSNNLGWFDHEVAVFGGGPASNCIVTLGNDVTPAGITFNANNGGSYTIAGPHTISTADGLKLVANGCGLISAPLVGSGGVTCTGGGSLTLCGTNSYRGTTTVGPGATVNVGGNQSGATGGWTLASEAAGAGVTVNFNAGSQVAVAGTNRISLRNSMGSGFASAVLNVAGTVTNSGTLDVNRLGVLTLQSGATWRQNGALLLGPGSSTSAGSALTVSNGATFIYAGAGPLDFSPSSGGSGGSTLTLDGGTFVTAQAFQNSTTNGSGMATLVLANGGTLALSANIAQLTTGAGANTCLSTGTGSVGGTIDTSVFSTTISNLITGSGSLTKRGVGSLTLSGANSYTGGTTVSNGTLLVNGSLGTGAVIVSSGATFGGTGTISGPMTLNGTVAPGSSTVGTLNTGSEIWNGGGGYQFSLNNTTNGSGGNFLNITGTLNIQSTGNNPFTIKLVSLTSGNMPGPLAGFASEGNYAWTLVAASGGIQNYGPKDFVVDTTRFSNAFAGTFSVSKKSGALLLTYSGAPLAAPSLSVASSSQTVSPQLAPLANNATTGAPILSFSFSGPAGQSYRVLTSTNPGLPLADWVVATNGVFGSGPSSYSDSATDGPQKFYRVLSP